MVIIFFKSSFFFFFYILHFLKANIPYVQNKIYNINQSWQLQPYIYVINEVAIIRIATDTHGQSHETVIALVGSVFITGIQHENVLKRKSTAQ